MRLILFVLLFAGAIALVAVLAAVSAVLRPGGITSVVTANRLAAVLHRAAAGRFDEALHALRDPLGRYSATDPAPRRFALADLEVMFATAGLAVVATHGSRVFADLVPGGSLDADPGAVEALTALELEASEIPAFREIATQLHVVGRRAPRVDTSRTSTVNSGPHRSRSCTDLAPACGSDFRRYRQARILKARRPARSSFGPSAPPVRRCRTVVAHW